MWQNIKYWFKHHDYAWKYKLEVCLPLFVFLVVCDWATKIAVQFTMNQGDIKDVMHGFMKVGYIINPGSAYGANAGSVAGSIAIAAVITLITAFIIVFVNDKMWLIAIVFIFSGSFANLIGRAWAPAVAAGQPYAGVKGGVIDFMQWGFHTFNADSYIFNVADLEVNIGVILLVIFLIVEIIKFIVSTVKKPKEIVEAVSIETSDVTIKAAKKAKEPRQYTDKELKAQQKLEKKMRKHEDKSN